MRKYLKTISFIFLLIVFISGCNQPIPSSQLTYSEVIEHNEPASNSFEISKMWLANTFNDSKSVIEYSNKENGTIIGKGISTNIYYGTFIGNLSTKYTLKIEVKDNKTRFTFSDMILLSNSNYSVLWNMRSTEELNQFKVKANKLILDYQTYINNKVSNSW